MQRLMELNSGAGLALQGHLIQLGVSWITIQNAWEYQRWVCEHKVSSSYYMNSSCCWYRISCGFISKKNDYPLHATLYSGPSFLAVHSLTMAVCGDVHLSCQIWGWSYGGHGFTTALLTQPHPQAPPKNRERDLVTLVENSRMCCVSSLHLE